MVGENTKSQSQITLTPAALHPATTSSSLYNFGSLSSMRLHRVDLYPSQSFSPFLSVETWKNSRGEILFTHFFSSWKSIRHEMFEVDTGLLFSSSFLIIPQLCFHMVRGETRNPDRFTSSSRLRCWAFQFFVLFPSFSRCATSQPAAQQSALLCFHNNHSILNYHFPPPPFCLKKKNCSSFLFCVFVIILFSNCFSRGFYSRESGLI